MTCRIGLENWQDTDGYQPAKHGLINSGAVGKLIDVLPETKGGDGVDLPNFCSMAHCLGHLGLQIVQHVVEAHQSSIVRFRDVDTEAFMQTHEKIEPVHRIQVDLAA